jgi:hypothetical protein
VDAALGPEMRSTGEILGLAPTFAAAMQLARDAEAAHLVPGAVPAVPAGQS